MRISPRYAVWLGAGAIVAAGLAAYSGSFSGPFVFDDISSIPSNPTLRHLGNLGTILATPHQNVSAAQRPILNLSLAVDYALGGSAVTWYHVTNLAIHLVAGLALFGVVRRTLLRLKAGSPTLLAAFAALLWTVHPLQTEAVTYLIQRAESLMGMFFLLTLYGFTRESKPWLAFSVACCWLGAGTKEVMAAAPILVYAYDAIFVSERWAAPVRARPGYYAALFGSWLFLGCEILRGGGNRNGTVGFGFHMPWLAYWLTQIQAIGRYLLLAVWPHPLIFEYGTFWVHSWGDLLPWACLVLPLLALTAVALVRRPRWGFLGLWFFLILGPTSVMPGTSQMIVEHRMYLSLAALMVALTLALRRQVILLALVGAAFAALTYARNGDYRTGLSLWSDTVAKRPNNALARVMYGEVLDQAGQEDAATRQYETAVQIYPDFPIAQEHLGEMLMKAGHPAAARPHFEIALRKEPDYADANDNLGVVLMQAGQVAEAMEHFRRALAQYPGYAEAHYNLAGALAHIGQGAAAVPEYEAALRAKPDYPAAEYNLANTLVDLGRVEEGVRHYLAALRLQPDYPQAEYNLGNAFAMTRRPADALPHFEQAVRLRPGYAAAEANWGSALFDLHRLDEAERHFVRALQLDPTMDDARENLAHLRAYRAQHGG